MSAQPSETVDGRRARGEARRRQLTDATLAVLEREGMAGLTHRAVAEQAGVPLASASYHFTGIDELIETTLLRAVEELGEALEEHPGDRSIARLAQILAEGLAARRDLLVAEYELYLMAMRRPHLQTAALAWVQQVAAVFAPDLVGAQRRALQALVEGIALHSIFGTDPADAETIEETLRAGWPGGADS